MGINDRNHYYDTQNQAPPQDDGTSSGDLAKIGGATIGLAGLGTLGAQLLSRRGATGLPATVLEMPLDILGPAGRRGAAGRFLPRNALGSLFTGPAGPALPQPTLGSLMTGPAGPALPRQALGSLMTGPAGPSLPRQGATAFPRTPQEALRNAGGDIEGLRPSATTAATGAAETAASAGPRGLARFLTPAQQEWLASGGRGTGTANVALRWGPRLGAPILGAAVAGPAESLGDQADKSGALGDFLGGASRGAGLGYALGGPWGSLAGGTVGGLWNAATGDSPAQERATANRAAIDEVLGQYQQFVDAGVITQEEVDAARAAAEESARAKVLQPLADRVKRENEGVSDEEAMAAARQIAENMQSGPFDRNTGDDPYVANQEPLLAEFAKAFGDIDAKINEAADPTTAIMAQLQGAYDQQQADYREAMTWAQRLAQPYAADQQQIYQDLAAVRDQRLQDPNLPADARAILSAGTPAVDAANLAAISAAANPLALIQPPENNLQDQLLQIYLAQLQYGGGGGGSSDLADMLTQGALDASAG